MKLLLLGSGGREHALAWKLCQSTKLEKLYIAPGNAGTSNLGTNVNISLQDFNAIKKMVLQAQIDMVVVGSEEPLVNGIVDFFTNDDDISHLPIIGPSKEGAQLEGSKDFAKKFMQKYNIPTAKYKSITKTNIKQGIQFLKTLQPPFVLKADGLAAGKGVSILDNLNDAEKELTAMLKGKFGKASSKVIIEEYLSGLEVSVFILTDGSSYILLPEAKDYKRLRENNTGPNTGGMGAISPVPFVDKTFLDKIEKKIITPTIKGLKKENIKYKGFIFFGLINCNGEPYVIEYNVRMGDPETQAILPRLQSDLLDLFIALFNGKLADENIKIIDDYVATVIVTSKGYPLKYEKGKEISHLHEINNSYVFHAGTIVGKNEKVITSGGRVIALSSKGVTIADALKKSYNAANILSFEGKNYRTDIGFDIL